MDLKDQNKVFFMIDRGSPRRTPNEDVGYATAPSRVEGKQNGDVEEAGEEGEEDWICYAV